ncbi:leucine-rich repeat domain-containing protein [Candidatus Poriferisodalis sp.]|uniref:leucine-rich repeat domain-containing protein n=1 Tax=Candidatus Poriferisodalis sp. TaxID=3101277 RepID=UPI003B029EA1
MLLLGLAAVACTGGGDRAATQEWDGHYERELVVGAGRASPPEGVFVDIAASELRTCGVREGGELVCWGERFAELEPAASVVVTLSVAGRSPDVVPTLYTVRVLRSRPVFGRAAVSMGRAVSGSGAGAQAKRRDDSAGCASAAGCGVLAGKDSGGASGASEGATASVRASSRLSRGAVGASSGAVVCAGAPIPPDQAVAVADGVLRATVHARPQQDGVVEFADGVLAGVVRAALGHTAAQTVTESELGGLARLAHVGSDTAGRVEDLSGLEHAAALEELRLRNNRVTDISPLAGFTGLERLGLIANRIADITPLAGLTRLGLLNIAGNRIADITPLAGLTGLRTLYSGGNRITGFDAGELSVTG